MPSPLTRDLSTDETWLPYTAATLSHFISSFPPDIQPKLDYSAASLDIVEEWMFFRYENLDAPLFDEDKLSYPGLVLYIGETFRRNLDGRWTRYLPEEDSDEFPYDEKTIIEGDFEDGYMNPFVDVREMLDHPLANGFRESLERLIQELAKRS